jgi:Holliday junction resolvase
MPNRSKDKGSRYERFIVNFAKSLGLGAYRVPLSGSCAGFKGDVFIAGRKLECKKRASGFKQIQKWIEGFDGVVIGSDRGQDLVVVRLNDWLKLL